MASKNIEKKKMFQDLTSGSVPKNLLVFALPFMLSNILQTVYSLVDMIVVGRFVGSSGLSAVTVASQTVMLMTTLCMGFSTGSQVYIAQLAGAGNKEMIRKTIGTTFSLQLLMGLGMGILGIILCRPALRLLNTPEEAMEEAVSYLLICGGAIIFTYGYNMVSAVLRGMGDSRRPFLFVAISSVVNLILDLLFVGVFAMGVAGAAWATILGQAVSFVVSIVYLYRRREEFGFDFAPSSFRIDPGCLKVLTKLGIPFGLQMSAITISMLFVNGLVNDYGIHAGATFGVGSRVSHIPDVLTRSIGMASSAMVGQNLGAGRADRAHKTVMATLVCAVGVYAVAAVVFLLFPHQIFSVFTKDEAVLSLSWLFILSMVYGFPAHALMVPFNSFIQGIGNAVLSLFISILDGFVTRILLSILLGKVLGMGLFGFFLGYNLAAYATGIPAMLYYVSGIWKKRKNLVGT